MTAPSVAARLLALEERIRPAGPVGSLFRGIAESRVEWADELAGVRVLCDEIAMNLKDVTHNMIPDSAAILDCVDALAARLAGAPEDSDG